MDSKLEEYVAAHISPEPEPLAALWRKANLSLVNGRMASGHIQGRLLKMLVQMSGARRVLEIGTFCGYSALCMAEGLPADGELHTIEIDDELEDFLRENALPLPGGEKIHLHFGDATEVMRSLEGTFDFIFIDADKTAYADYYREALPLLSPRGVIVADNTLWDGHVVDAAYDRDKQTKGIRRFNDVVAADDSVEKVIVPLRDGLTVIRRRQ